MTGRAQRGFTAAQTAAGYRALRASVIRLWTKAEGRPQASDIEDPTRFDEAIDQALGNPIGNAVQDGARGTAQTRTAERRARRYRCQLSATNASAGRTRQSGG